MLAIFVSLRVLRVCESCNRAVQGVLRQRWRDLLKVLVVRLLNMRRVCTSATNAEQACLLPRLLRSQGLAACKHTSKRKASFEYRSVRYWSKEINARTGGQKK